MQLESFSEKERIECMTTAKEFVELIDEKYQWAKMNKFSRMSVEWGKWSREMNLRLRKMIEDGVPDAIRLKYVMNYWTMKSQLLELHQKKYSSGVKKKKLAKELKEYKKMILHDEILDDFKYDYF